MISSINSVVDLLPKHAWMSNVLSAKLCVLFEICTDGSPKLSVRTSLSVFNCT